MKRAEVRNPTRKALVVVAAPPLPNLGMLFSDYVASRLSVWFPEWTFVLVRTYDPRFRKDQRSSISEVLILLDRLIAGPYASLISERPRPLGPADCDAVLFWGDFLHSADYARSCSHTLDAEALGLTPQQIEESLVRSLFLLDEGEEALCRVGICGQSLLHNHSSALLFEDYYRRMRRLYRGAAVVWMRDLPSARIASELRRERLVLSFGPDVVSFLSLLQPPRIQGEDAGKIGCFLGRGAQARDRSFDLVQKIADVCESQVEWIPWLFQDQEASTSSRECQMRSVFCPEWFSIDSLVRRLQSYRAVITDTYHLSVVSWSLGIPAVCLVGHSPALPFDQSMGWFDGRRDKRYEFFSALDALAFLCDISEANGSTTMRDCRLELVAQCLGDRILRDTLVQRLRHQARAGLKRLKPLLGAPCLDA